MVEGAASMALSEDARSPMRSPVNWALLGLIIERAGSGYELHQRIEREYENLLSPSPGNVYKALEQLKGRGFIEEVPGSRTTEMDQRRSTVMYRATSDGLLHYQERLLAQVLEDRHQAWIWLRQLAAFANHPDLGLEVIEHMSREYAAEARGMPSTGPGEPPVGLIASLVTRLAAEEKRLAMESKLPFVEYVRSEFKALAGRSR